MIDLEKYDDDASTFKSCNSFHFSVSFLCWFSISPKNDMFTSFNRAALINIKERQF